jgi:tRNA (mo5U34)-methyltransferase
MSGGAVRLDDERALRRRIEALGPWFQNLRIGGVETAPDHFLGDYPAFKFAGFAHALPDDLTGKSVLDIGCNAGFYSIEMKRRGAAEVLGIDTDERYLAQARFAADMLGYDGIGFEKLSVYDVGALGRRFDLVIFMGVLYHLRHPLLALDLIREHVAGDLLLFQTMQRGVAFDNPAYPRMHFIERKYANDWTNWWAPNAACSQAMLRAAGFHVEAQPEEEVYLCRVAPVPYADWMGSAAVYPERGSKA